MPQLWHGENLSSAIPKSQNSEVDTNCAGPGFETGRAVSYTAETRMARASLSQAVGGVRVSDDNPDYDPILDDEDPWIRSAIDTHWGIRARRWQLEYERETGKSVGLFRCASAIALDELRIGNVEAFIGVLNCYKLKPWLPQFPRLTAYFAEMLGPDIETSTPYRLITKSRGGKPGKRAKPKHILVGVIARLEFGDTKPLKKLLASVALTRSDAQSGDRHVYRIWTPEIAAYLMRMLDADGDTPYWLKPKPRNAGRGRPKGVPDPRTAVIEWLAYCNYERLTTDGGSPEEAKAEINRLRMGVGALRSDASTYKAVTKGRKHR